MLKFNYVNKALEIACFDNGMGIKEESLNSSNGLSNMKERANKIGGLITIQSKENEGTTIIFKGKTT